MAITPSEITFRQKITGESPAATNDGQILFINQDSVDASFWSAVSNGGGNILAYADVDGNTRLPLEVVKCDTANSTLLLWSRKPSYSTTDRDIVIMCSNVVTTQPAASASFGSQAVWFDYRAVYHLNESANTTPGGYKDSTVNELDGTGHGLNESNRDLLNGLVGSGFDGSNDYISLPAATFPAATNTEYSITVWAEPDSLSSDSRVFSAAQSGSTNNNKAVIWADVGGAGKGWAGHTQRGDRVSYLVGTGDSTASVGRWDYLTLNSTSTELELYVNGVSRGVDTMQSPTDDVVDDVFIGALDLGSNQMDGGIAGVRISLVALSDSFVDTEYSNQSAPATFWTQSAADDPSASSSARTANISINVSSPVFSIDGNNTSPVYTASAAYTNAAPTFQGESSVAAPAYNADINYTVSSLAFSANANNAAPGNNATASFSFSAPVFSGDSSVINPAGASASFSVLAPIFNADSIATVPVINSTVDINLPAPVFSIDATAESATSASTINFTLELPSFSASASIVIPDNNASISYTLGGPQFSVIAGLDTGVYYYAKGTGLKLIHKSRTLTIQAQSRTLRI